MAERKKVTTSTLMEMRAGKQKIAMLTAYDYTFAKILDEAQVDIILVGDSAANVVLGYENTLPITMDEMIHHTKAVRRGVKYAMLVADMPFGSFQGSKEEALKNAIRFVKEAGAEGVKTEGDLYMDAMAMMIDAGIPVMGHLGFTPQLINQIGGYKVQGRGRDEAGLILKAAKDLERIGVFSIVLEMVPASLAKKIRDSVKIPVIGIGAGPFCDGQVLVTHDILGLYRPAPRFAKMYANIGEEIKRAVISYIREVREGKFPTEKESF